MANWRPHGDRGRNVSRLEEEALVEMLGRTTLFLSREASSD